MLLLRTLADALVDWQPSADGSGVTFMPSMYHEGSYAELERALAEMRESGHRPQWWHVCHRYRWGVEQWLVAPVTRTQTGQIIHLPANTELVASGPAVGPKHALVRVYRWHDRVRPVLVAEGVEWLVLNMYQGDYGRINLPRSVLDRPVVQPRVQPAVSA